MASPDFSSQILESVASESAQFSPLSGDIYNSDYDPDSDYDPSVRGPDFGSVELIDLSEQPFPLDNWFSRGSR